MPFNIEQVLSAACHATSRGLLDQAERGFKQILAEVPEHAGAALMLGVTALHANRWDEALAYTRQALIRDPALAPAMNNQILLLSLLQRPMEAIKAGYRTLAIAPDHVGAKKQLATALTRVLAFVEAKPILSQLVGEHGDDSLEFRQMLGKAHAETGDYDRALAIYLDILVEIPNHRDTYDEYRRVVLERSRVERLAAQLCPALPRPSIAPPATDITIYVKCYSRPMYLDRCLASIKRHVTGYGRIVVLNDGIGDVYMQRIRERHPTVEIRSSPKVQAGVIAAPANQRLQQRVAHFRTLDYLDPLRFWADEVGRDPNEHVVIIEEDCWFLRPCDLRPIVDHIYEHGAISLNMMYENEEKRKNRISERPPEVEKTTKDGVSVHINNINPHYNWQANYSIFSLAQSIISKDYWVACYEDNNHWTNEHHLLTKAARMVQWLRRQGLRPRSGCVNGGLIRHSRSSTARSDGGSPLLQHSIDPYLYNGLINQLWLEGTLDIMAGYPDDLPEAYIVHLMEPYLSPDQILAWRRWRQEFLIRYPFYNQ